MSWGAPRRLRPFPETGPFAGLPVPQDVDISSQVMAQPDPDLPDRVLASLEDGTPLVTGRSIGDGRVVLFHVTGERRLVEPAAVGAVRADAGAADPECRWPGVGAGDAGGHDVDAAAGAGRLRRAGAAAAWSPACRASGWRRRGRRRRPLRGSMRRRPAGGAERHARRTIGWRRSPRCPDGVRVETLDLPAEVRLGPWLIGARAGLLAIDVLATLVVSGRLGAACARDGSDRRGDPRRRPGIRRPAAAEAQRRPMTRRRSTPRTRRSSPTC